MSLQLIAVDLGGTNLRVASYDGETPLPKRIQKTPTQAEQGPERVIERIVGAIADMIDEEAAELRIGVGAPGPLDPNSGIVYEAPNLPGWDDIPLGEKLRQHFGVPVGLGNDANMAALGEWRHGAGRGTRHLVYLTVSTGIGGGAVVDGQLLLGARGMGAEMGHITLLPDGPPCGCGKRGHLEALASGSAIARIARERLEGDEVSSLRDHRGVVTAATVGGAAQAGDSLALDILDEAATYLGIGLADFAHLLNPEVFVLGGGVSQLGDLFLEPVRKSFRSHVLHPYYAKDVPVVQAQLGDDAGLVGAMVLASELGN